MKARTIQGVNSSYRAMLTAATTRPVARDRRMKPFIRRWSPEGAVVGHQRHHALADADAGVEGQTLHLEHDADGGESRIAVGTMSLSTTM